MKILVAGNFQFYSLESSYLRGFRELGLDAEPFDMVAARARFKRFGKLGRYLTQFVEVEPWTRKINRHLAATAIANKIDTLVVGGEAEVSAGAIAQLKITLGLKAVLIWPDPLVSLNNSLMSALPLYDYIGSYSKEAIPQFRALGAKNAQWLPLGADLALHGAPPPAVAPEIKHDVSFVGGWRPEREEALTKLARYNVGIWGPEWGKRCKGNAVIQKFWKGRPAVAEEYVGIARASAVSLNVIDPTNYPAANMRFFELPLAGAVQLCSPCPEMDQEFREGREILYFQDAESMLAKIEAVLKNPSRFEPLRSAGRAKILEGHTYKHRARQIVESLSGQAG